MKLIELLNENFALAATSFKKAAAEDQVTDALAAYKALAQKNQFSGNEKDINWWIKQGWDKFLAAVTAKLKTPSKTQIKQGNMNNALVINLPVPATAKAKVSKIVIPLNYAGARNSGKNSKFCTSTADTKSYDQIVLIQMAALVYVIMVDGTFLAISTGPSYTIFWNNANDEISGKDWSAATGIPLLWLSGMIRQQASKISAARQAEMVSRKMIDPTSTASKDHALLDEITDFHNFLAKIDLSYH